MMKYVVYGLLLACLLFQGCAAGTYSNRQALTELRSENPNYPLISAKLEKVIASGVYSGKDLGNTYNLLGWAYGGVDAKQKALDAYNQAIRINPDYPYAYNNRGVIHQEMGRLEEAESDYITCVSKSNDKRASCFCYANMGETQIAMGRLTEAVNSFKLAIKIDGCPRAHITLGEYFLAIGKIEAARAKFDSVLKRVSQERHNFAARHGLGLASFVERKYGDAVTHLSKAVSMQPRSGAARISLYLAKRLKGHDDKTILTGSFNNKKIAAMAEYLAGRVAQKELIRICGQGNPYEQNVAMVGANTVIGYKYLLSGNTGKAKEYFKKATGDGKMMMKWGYIIGLAGLTMIYNRPAV